MADDSKLTFSKQDRLSVCELRKSVGKGCRNCVYDDVCNSGAQYRAKLRKEGMVLRTNPDKQPKTNKRAPNRSKPLKCVESGYVFESRKQICDMLHITRKELQKHLDLKTPIEVKLTLEEITDNT